MAREVHEKDIAPTLLAASQWIQECLIEDRSVFSADALWTASIVQEVHHAFVDHPDFGADDFMTKLKKQMSPASPAAQRLMAEMLWALLLFPSNVKARTKRHK
jgi:5-methylcytosine-specific restriction enzyme B